MTMQRTTMLVMGLGVLVAACGGETPEAAPAAAPTGGTVVAVRDTTVSATSDATGNRRTARERHALDQADGERRAGARPRGRACREGAAAGAARPARPRGEAQQAEAALADVEAQRDLALVHATRMRALHADSAAPTAMLDAAESGLRRAEAGVRAAKAGTRRARRRDVVWRGRRAVRWRGGAALRRSPWDIVVAGRRVGASPRRSWLQVKLTPLVTLASLAVGVLGIIATPREEEPQISVPMIDVIAQLPGAGPPRSSRTCSRPIERACGDRRRGHVYTMSGDGYAMVTVRFAVGETRSAPSRRCMPS
jgi:hypothetical protein